MTVTIQGSGTASVGGIVLASGVTSVFAPAESLVLTLTPGTNQSLSSLTVNGNPATLSDNALALSAQAGTSAVVVAAFVSHTAGAVPTARITSNGDTSAATAALTKQAEIALANKVIASEIPYVLYDVKPVWNDSTGNELTVAEITTAGGVTFTLDPPPNTTAENYNYEVYHFNGTGFDKVSSSLTVTTADFSAFAVFGIPKAAAAATGTTGTTGTGTGTTSGTTSGTTTGTTVVVEKTTPEPPTLRFAPIVNDGAKQTGAIMDVNSTMEYMREGSSEGYKAIAGTMLDDLAAGTYYVRYKATTTTNPSPATTVKIREYYTVKLELLYGKGSYEVTSDNGLFETDTYLVLKGGDITIKFTPDNHYWLHEIRENGTYIGSARMRNPFSLTNVTAAKVISYGFSDSTSSPKTGDESNVALYVVTALVAAAGITGICIYLFKRKKK